MGPIEQNIAKQAMRSREPLPDRIANAPEVRQGLEFFLQAFFDLDSERAHGYNALGRIPWHLIKEYAAFYDLDVEQIESLFYFIAAMDVAHLKRLEGK